MCIIYSSDLHGVHENIFGVHENFRVHETNLGVHETFRLHIKKTLVFLLYLFKCAKQFNIKVKSRPSV